MPFATSTIRERARRRVAVRVRAGEPCALCREPIDLSLRYPDPLSFTVDHADLVDIKSTCDKIIREMGRTLKTIRDERGLSIIVSEQVLSFALDVADRVLVIENGVIVHESLRADIDEAQVARFLSV